MVRPSKAFSGIRSTLIFSHRNERAAKQSGFTLSELAIVLGVAGMLIGGIWVAASAVIERNRQNRAVEELNTVAQNMVTLYQNRAVDRNTNGAAGTGCGAWSPNALETLISNSLIPAWAVTSSSTASTPWGGAFIVYNPPGGATNNIFRISFYCIPFDACIKLLLQATDCDPTQPGCPVKVMTDRAQISAMPQNPLPAGVNGWQIMTPATADALCSLNNYKGGGNSVEFDYKL